MRSLHSVPHRYRSIGLRKCVHAYKLYIYIFVYIYIYTEKRTNEWVLNTAEAERQLLESIRKRKLAYFL